MQPLGLPCCQTRTTVLTERDCRDLPAVHLDSGADTGKGKGYHAAGRKRIDIRSQTLPYRPKASAYVAWYNTPSPTSPICCIRSARLSLKLFTDQPCSPSRPHRSTSPITQPAMTVSNHATPASQGASQATSCDPREGHEMRLPSRICCAYHFQKLPSCQRACRMRDCFPMTLCDHRVLVLPILHMRLSPVNMFAAARRRFRAASGT